MTVENNAVEGNVIIVVSGGLIDTVYSNGVEQEVTILDHDQFGDDENTVEVDGVDVVVSTIATEYLPEAMARDLGFEHLINPKAESIGTHKGYDIVKYYGNKIQLDDEWVVYGDIFTSLTQLFAAHPESEVSTGYGLIDPFTGLHPSDAPDWFATIGEVIYYIDELPAQTK